MVYAVFFLHGSSSHAKNRSYRLISLKNICRQRILKSSSILTYDPSIRTSQKSDTSTFHSPFTLSKMSGQWYKATWFLVRGLKVPGFAHFSYVNCYLINFLQNLIQPLLKTWKRNWKQFWTDNGQYILIFFELILSCWLVENFSKNIWSYCILTYMPIDNKTIR